MLPEDYPLLLAGGVADGDDVAWALAAGATAAVAGTRFLMAEESVRALHRVTRPAFARVPDGVQGWLLRPVSGLG